MISIVLRRLSFLDLFAAPRFVDSPFRVCRAHYLTLSFEDGRKIGVPLTGIIFPIQSGHPLSDVSYILVPTLSHPIFPTGSENFPFPVRPCFVFDSSFRSFFRVSGGVPSLSVLLSRQSFRPFVPFPRGTRTCL